MCKASVIIAAYNIENYIERCLNSITRQTLEDIEIIVVNDGSTDKTLEKINNIAKNDKRVRVINKENQGVIEARRSGYNIAVGEYILFIDGDDWIDINSIELLYNNAKSGDYDIVCNNYSYAFDDGTFQEVKQIATGELIGEKFLEAVMLEYVFPSICSKFIKKEFIDINNIIFPSNMTYGEDLAMSIELALNNPKVSFIELPLYFYYQRMNSVTNIISDKIFDINKSIKFIKNKLEEKNIYNKYVKEFEFMVFNHNFNYRMTIILGKNKKYSKEIYEIWKSYRINLSTNMYIEEFLSREGVWTRIGIRLLNLNYIIGKLYFSFKNIIVFRKNNN